MTYCIFNDLSKLKFCLRCEEFHCGCTKKIYEGNLFILRYKLNRILSYYKYDSDYTIDNVLNFNKGKRLYETV